MLTYCYKKLTITRWLLYLTLALAPLYVVRLKISSVLLFGEFPTTLLEILILLTAFSWILEGRSAVIRDTLAEIRRSLPLILFLLAGIISLFVSPDRYGALGSFKAYVAEPILIYLVVKNTVQDNTSRFMVLFSLFISGLWLSILAVLQGLFGWFVVTPHEMVENRAHGVYNTANALGLYLGPLVMLAIGVVCNLLLKDSFRNEINLQRNKLSMRPLYRFVKPIFSSTAAYCCLIFFSILAIFLSKSAGALVGLAVAGVFTLVSIFSLKSRSGVGEISVKKRQPLGNAEKILQKFVLGLLIFTFLGTFLFVLFVVPRVVPPGTTPPTRVSKNTTVIRFCLWEGTRNLLLKNPILGAGLSGFKEVYRDFRTCDAELLEYPHNIFLNFWSEMGLLGLISFLWLTSRWIKLCLSNVTRAKFSIFNPPRADQFSISFLAALIYIFVHGLVDVPYFKNDLALEFWVLLALLETSKGVIPNSNSTSNQG